MATRQARVLEQQRVRLEFPVKTVVAAVVTIGWMAIAFLFRDAAYDAFAVASSLALMIASALFYLWSPGPGQEGFRVLSFFVCAQTFLTNGLSIIFPVSGNQFTTVEAYSFAALSSAIFALMFIAGAWVTAPRRGQKLAEPLTDQTGPSKSVSLVLAVGTVAATISLMNASFAARVGMIPLILFNGSLILPMLTATRLTTSRTSYLPMAIVLGANAAFTFYTSMLGVVMLAMRDVVLTYVALRRRLPLAFLAVALAAVVIINPAKAVFREMLQEDRNPNGDLSLEQTTEMWGESLQTTWSQKGPRSRDDSSAFEQTSSRLDYNWLGAHVYSIVPSKVPYQWGATYEDIPMLLVPRILNPDKPTSNAYTRSRWLVKLGVQDRTSINTVAFPLPASAEAYWNFGWLGVFLVPLLFGLIVGGALRIAPRDQIARSGYYVLLATSAGSFPDMLIWVVAPLVFAVMAVPIASFYCGIGKTRLAESRRRRTSHVRATG